MEQYLWTVVISILLLGFFFAIARGIYQEFCSWANNENLKSVITFQFIFRWYDLWVGFYWDRKKKYLYIFPLPCFGIIAKFSF